MLDIAEPRLFQGVDGGWVGRLLDLSAFSICARKKKTFRSLAIMAHPDGSKDVSALSALLPNRSPTSGATPSSAPLPSPTSSNFPVSVGSNLSLGSLAALASPSAAALNFPATSSLVASQSGGYSPAATAVATMVPMGYPMYPFPLTAAPLTGAAALALGKRKEAASALPVPAAAGPRRGGIFM